MTKIKLNTDLSPDDTWAIVHQEIQENKFSDHSIKSINDLYDVGIGQIMTKVFKIDHVMDNIRDKTPQDRLINKIRFTVDFENIRLKMPVTAGYCSGKEKVLTPIQAHVEDRTYSSHLFVDAPIRAWAINHDGTETLREARVPNFRLANIPTMTGSKLCNTYNKSADALTQWHEDARDARAYFIKNGKEWVIDNVENIAFNQPRIFMNYWRNEIMRLEFISKPGDTYQNSKQVLLRFMNNGALTVEIVTPNLRNIQFPFFLIFRALGWFTDKEMLDSILYRNTGYPGDDVAAENTDSEILFRKMTAVIEESMTAPYDTKNHKFGNSATMHGQVDVLKFLIRQMGRDVFKDLDLLKDEHVQQAINKLLHHFDEDFLPHIGLDETARPMKLRFLGHFINRMLYVKMGLLQPTDRDGYQTKRVHTVGISLGKAFKTHFNTAIVNQIRKQFIKDFKAMSFNSVNLQQTFQISVNGADFERLLMQSITSATQTTLKVNRYRTVINRLSSQLLDRKNYTKIYSTIRTVISPGGDSSKGSDRAKEMRMPHPSFHGFICYIQSADGGEKVGLHKQLGISASICSYSDSEMLKQKIIADRERCVPVAEVSNYAVPNMSKIFVNGDWIACAHDSSEFIEAYTNMRRELKIDEKTTIEWNENMNEVYLWVDYGRPCRPLMIVYNNMRDWRAMGLAAPAAVDKFEQGLALTKEIFRDLKAGRLTMRDLQKMGVVEYITPQEQVRLDVAADILHLRTNQTNPLRQFTHCDIPEALLGIPALTGPLAHMSQTTRNTFQTAQVRQTGGVYSYNWAYRVDKDTFVQYQVGNPVVYTRVNDYIPPNGDTVIAAVMCYSGFNEEDSLLLNKASGERLKFNGSWFTYDKVELEKNEQFANPDVARTMGIKNYANYSKLGKNGIVPIGTIVRNRDIVVGKIKRLPKNIAEEKKVEYQDCSMVYKMEFPSIVHNVIIAKDDEATMFVKVAYRSTKPTIIGDKFCATADHEVLTSRGWRAINEITVDDKVATLVDGELKYDGVQAVYMFDHAGEMMEINNGNLSCRVTMEHKNYASIRDAPFALHTSRDVLASGAAVKFAGRGTMDFDSRETFRIPASRHIVDGEVVIRAARVVDMDDWLTLCREVYFKGYMVNDGIYCMSFADDEFIAAVARLGCLVNGHYIRNDQVVDYFKRNPEIPQWCRELDQRQSKILIAPILNSVNEIKIMSPTFEQDGLAVKQIGRNAGYDITIVTKFVYWKVESIKNVYDIAREDVAVTNYTGKVYCIEVPSHIFMMRRSGTTCGYWTGNSARSGQKGIVSLILNQSDMPFTESGIIPDIIINPHAFPKRMTNSYHMETILGKICAKRGVYCDGTIFRSIDPDLTIKEMKSLGMDCFGRERMYCGLTGTWIDSLIFMGPMYYQRLQKFVAKSVYSIDVGPTDIMTRQPLDGKANQGGLRISELQRDVLLAHGCAKFFSEKFFTDSDDFEVYVCRCGSRAIVNHNIGIYECPTCKDDANIYAIYSSWSSKQFLMELNACHVGTQFKLEPFTFYDGI